MTILLVAYAAMAIFCFGWFFALWQKGLPTLAAESRAGDIAFCALFALIWPVGILPALFVGVGRKRWQGWKLP